MLLKLYIFIYQCIILYNEFIKGNVKALIGENVRIAAKNEFPFVVSIMRSNSQVPQPEMNHICTGSLITPRDILTAEHCLEGDDRKGIHIVAGSNDLKTGKHYFIFWWITHNNWKSQFEEDDEYEENDITVSRLLDHITINSHPVKITNKLGVDFFDVMVEVAGWGASNTGSMPHMMQAMNVTVKPITNCKMRIEKLVNKKILFNPKYLCTVAEPYGLLQAGDNGGPLIYKGTIIGINRSASPITEKYEYEKKVNLHLSIEFYKTFIANVTNLL